MELLGFMNPFPLPGHLCLKSRVHRHYVPVKGSRHYCPVVALSTPVHTNCRHLWCFCKMCVILCLKATRFNKGETSVTFLVSVRIVVMHISDFISHFNDFNNFYGGPCTSFYISFIFASKTRGILSSVNAYSGYVGRI